MRGTLASAFVLHRRPYRESSLLIEAWSRDQGRIGLVARGAGRARSRLRGLLQPFAPLLLSWSGRGELGTLTAVEEQGRPIRPPPERLLSGLYLNELLLALLARQDPHPLLFDGYREALTELGAVPDQEPVLRRFEVLLLAQLGYGLQLDREADSGKPLDATRDYRYVLDRGPLPLTASGGGMTISGRSLCALARGELHEPGILREVKRLTRAALAAHLNRPLHSRTLMNTLHRRPIPETQDEIP